MSVESLLADIEAAASGGDVESVASFYRRIVDEDLIHDLTDDHIERLRAAVATTAENSDGRTVDVNRDGLADGNASASPQTSAGASSNECPYRDVLYEDELYLHMFNNSEILELADARQRKIDETNSIYDEAQFFQDAIDNFDQYSTDMQYRAEMQDRYFGIIEGRAIPIPFVNFSPEYAASIRDIRIEEADQNAAELDDIDTFNRLVAAKLIEVQFAFADEARNLCEKKEEIEEYEGYIADLEEELIAFYEGSSAEERQIFAAYNQSRGATELPDGSDWSPSAQEYRKYLHFRYSGRPGVYRETLTETMRVGIAAEMNLHTILLKYTNLLSGQDITTSAEFWHQLWQTVKWAIIEEVVTFAAAVATGGVAYTVRALRYIQRARDFQQIGRAARAATIAILLRRGIQRQTAQELQNAFLFATGKSAIVSTGTYARRINRAENATDAARACRRCT